VSERPAPERRADLLELYRELSPDWVCPLKESRTNVVFGSGNADAELMFVGEAPGANEDREGKPFVGNAGRLLDKLLVEIGLERGDTFIANVLKCRPPGNRDPQPHEIEECTPHLMRQVELIEPTVVCTLGNFALKLLSGSPQGISKVHGRPQAHEIGGRSVVLYPLFHPSAALRATAVLELLRADFARLPGLLAAQAPAGEAKEGSGSVTGGDQLGFFG
jgi:DNA polymerase